MAGAVRELAEETGVVVAPEDLTDLGRFELVTDDRGTFHFHAFVARTTLSDRDVECHEGRQMVFVDPAHLAPRPGRSRPLAPQLRAWIDGHPFVARPGAALLRRRHPRRPPAAGSCCRSATSTRAIDPEKWGLAGGHLEPGENFEPAATASSRRRRACGWRRRARALRRVRRRPPQAYGTWDRMQVFVAATDLTDADIDCHEGRQIVFVDPACPRLDLTPAPPSSSRPSSTPPLRHDAPGPP